jgi:hypothetical protein
MPPRWISCPDAVVPSTGGFTNSASVSRHGAPPWSLVPSQRIRVKVAEARSRVAIALCSWRTTCAVDESAETTMYSGSRSFPSVAPGPYGRISGSMSLAGTPPKPTVFTVATATPAERSTIDTLPGASTE